MYVDDFIKIVKYYLDNVNNSTILEKTINVCYNKKYKLSAIANLIVPNAKDINILNPTSLHNYSGNNTLLEALQLNLLGLEQSLILYESKLHAQ